MTHVYSQSLDPFERGQGLGLNSVHEAFLGPAPGPSRMDPYEQRNISKWNMPENYKGKNYYLGDTVEDLLFTADQTWYTERVMPWETTEDIHLQWTKLEANAHILDIAPHQSEPYAVTQKRSIRRAQLIRRGISAEFESDFLKTPMGRISFLATLRQFANSVQETANLEIERALLNSHHFQKQFQRQYGVIREKDLKGYFKRDTERFAVAQRVKNGLSKLDTQISTEMRKWGGKANGYLIPEEISVYATLVRSEVTDYDKAGYRGPDRVAGEGTKYLANSGTTDPLDRVEPIRMVNGQAAFLVRSRYIENVGQMDLLQNRKQVGEYNTMLDENTDYTEYTTASRNIVIYNEDIDDWSEIKLVDAINNCNLFDEDGNLKIMKFDPRRSGKDIDDARRDFLSYFSNGQMQTAKYLYHIDPEYLPVSTLLNAAQTIDNALQRMGAERPVIDFAEGFINIVEFNTFREQVRVLSDFLGLSIKKPGRDRTDPVDVAKYLLPGQVPVISSAVGASSSTVDIQQGMFDMLATQVPARKREEITSLSSAHGSFLEQIEAVRGKLAQFAEEKLKGIKLKNTAAVDKYVDAAISQYNATIQSVGSSASVGGEIVGYMHAGQDLSGTPYRYLYKGSERKTTGDRAVDQNTHHRIQADMAFDARSASSSSAPRQTRDTGVGLGLEGIGQYAYGDSREGVRRKLNDIQTFMLASEIKHNTNIVNSSASGYHKLLARAFTLLPITRQSMLNLAQNNILVPMNFLLFRPHMQYKMRTLIKCQLDGGSGKTYIGHTDLGIEGEIATKTQKMNFTTYMRAVVKEPKNVYVQHNVFSEEYQGGNGIGFYNPESYRTHDPDDLRESIICIAVPCVERNFPSPMDTSGRHYVEYASGLVTERDFRELHYSTAFRANQEYGFHIAAKKQGNRLENYSSQTIHENRRMYQGHQWMYNAKLGKYDKVRTNKGHWGSNVYPGVGKIRNGSIENEMREMDYTNTSL